MTTERPRRRSERRDAIENRERLLRAAEERFARDGIDAPLTTVIRDSGLAPGTFYRNFPTADDLFVALYRRIEERLDEVLLATETAPDGWQAIEVFLDLTVEIVFDHPEIPAVMQRARQIDPETDRGAKYREPLARYVREAQEQGRLRRDVVPTDIAALPYLLATGLSHYPEPVRSSAYARFRTILLDGLTQHGLTPLDAAPMSADTFRDIAHRSYRDDVGDPPDTGTADGRRP